MSDRSRLIRYTDPALLDLQAIAAYGIEQWGASQAFDYLNSLYTAIERLAEHPRLGAASISFHSGTRRLAVREHVVYYRPIGPSILVQRIVHHRMDSRQLFEESPICDEPD